MKNSGNQGFDQHFNAQIAVDQPTLLIVSTFLSNHPNDQLEALPTVDAIHPKLGKPKRAVLDAGYFSLANVNGFNIRQIDPYIATGRPDHHFDLTRLQAPTPPAADASLKVQMAYKLNTATGKAIYRLRKCTVEPVFGIIKETMGFRQFSLRGLTKAAGEWCLVCLAFNLRRLHRLMGEPSLSPTGC